MKGFSLLLFFAFWLVVIYFGWIYLTGKVLKANPRIDSAVGSRQQRYMQRQADESRERQRELMIQREQRLRDLQR